MNSQYLSVGIFTHNHIAKHRNVAIFTIKTSLESLLPRHAYVLILLCSTSLRINILSRSFKHVKLILIPKRNDNLQRFRWDSYFSADQHFSETDLLFTRLKLLSNKFSPFKRRGSSKRQSLSRSSWCFLHCSSMHPSELLSVKVLGVPSPCVRSLPLGQSFVSRSSVTIASVPVSFCV